MQGTQLSIERDLLVHEAATALGLLIFEFTRLDMELGLFLTWSDNGQSMGELVKKVSAQTFSQRMDLLRQLAVKRYAESPETQKSFFTWLADANKLRVIRNELFHGRWGFEPRDGRVANVTGLPNSDEQQSTFYSISELHDIVETTRSLRTRLDDLRSSHPL
ncbi:MULTISPECIES: hypothetical protein [Dyella]|uniref:Uncharacterized protein n=2 Tax=Dyella TaxID=231454 RepID=A0A4R0YGK6_9GAMM|nr:MULTISPECIES: hypothetical protein [Dyella]TBR36052.1 hypothetical protein EYV96_15705 [Dyella terrae]TCI06102.1 hypothetical protein EZM97_34800 [Dyella soli]